MIAGIPNKRIRPSNSRNSGTFVFINRPRPDLQIFGWVRRLPPQRLNLVSPPFAIDGKTMDPDSPICLCFNVSRRKIIRFIKVDKPRRASQLSECFGAGTGCGWCRPILERLNQQHSTLPEASQSVTPVGQIDQELDSMDSDQYQAARQAYRDQKRAQAQSSPAADPPPTEDSEKPAS